MKNGIKIIVHASNKRMWYVQGYLVPSLLSQGFTIEEIKIWLDKERKGNLRAFVECMQWIGQNLDEAASAWHIQDDVIISKNFKKETEKDYGGRLVCGFCCVNWDRDNYNKIGEQPTENLWFSFPCICIPNKYALEFVQWFHQTGSRIERFKNLLDHNKGDDSFFREFIAYKHHREYGFNLKPNIVQHIDYLIGGSIVNSDRRTVVKSFYWEQDELIRGLEKKLASVC